MKYSRIDLAYAAGIIDGEGNIGVYSNRSRRVKVGATFRLVVQVGMSDEEPVKFLNSVFGGFYHKYSGLFKGRATWNQSRYVWQLCNIKAGLLLQELLPYLKGKKDQAILGIEFQKTIHPKGGILHEVTQVEYDRRKKISDRLKELKRI